MYDNNGDYFGFNYNGTEYYYLKNAQNDVIGITLSDGTLIAKYYYDAWGNLLDMTDANNDYLAPPNRAIAEINPIRYRSYYLDSELGYYYLNTRYYMPDFGRFLNADSVVSGVGESVQGYNLFAYCINNPVNMSDESGQWPTWSDIKNAVSRVAKVIYSFAESFALEIGVGIGARAGANVSSGSAGVKINAGHKSDLINVNIGKGKVNVGYKEKGGTSLGVGPMSIGNEKKCLSSIRKA